MSMNELKKSTYMALIAVLITAIALGTATYAWFVNSQTVEAEQISFSSTTTSDLLIAVHKAGATVENQSELRYQSLLSNEDVQEYVSMVPGLQGVSTVSAAAFYTNNGMKADGSSGGVDDNGFDLSNKAEYFKAAQDSEGLYLALPIWFRTSTDAEVYLREGAGLTSGTAITAKAIAGAPKGQYLTRAIVMAFKPDGEAAVLLEPDPAETGGDYPRRNTTKFGDTTVPDKYGIVALTAENRIANIEPQDRKSTNELFVKTDNLDRLTRAELDGIYSAQSPLFQLKGGVPKKVTVYVWLDGMDYDCVSDISGGLLSVKLAFIGGETK